MGRRQLSISWKNSSQQNSLFFGTFNINYEKISLLFKPSVCDILLWQPEQINILADILNLFDKMSSSFYFFKIKLKKRCLLTWINSNQQCKGSTTGNSMNLSAESPNAFFRNLVTSRDCEKLMVFLLKSLPHFLTQPYIFHAGF